MAEKQKEARIAIEALGEKHDRTVFSCGVDALDSYLHKQIGQDTRKRVAVAFVATADGQAIAGYYTLSQYAIGLDVIPEEVAKRLPKYPMVSATLLGRLAVSTEFRGQVASQVLSWTQRTGRQLHTTRNMVSLNCLKWGNDLFCRWELSSNYFGRTDKLTTKAIGFDGTGH